MSENQLALGKGGNSEAIDGLLLACALARVNAITGQECLAMTGASKAMVVEAINSEACKRLAIRIQTDGLAQEVAAQLDLYRAQLALRERLQDPELSTSALLAIGQFLYAIGGIKERRQVKVAQASGPVFSIVQIFDTDPPEVVALKQQQAVHGVALHLPASVSTKNVDSGGIE